MAGKEIAVKKYVVRLDAEERDRLNELIRKGKRSAQLLTKARILLKADVSELGEGWSDTISFLRWGDTTVGEESNIGEIGRAHV